MEAELKKAARRVFRNLGWYSGARRAARVYQFVRTLFGAREQAQSDDPEFLARMSRQPYDVDLDGLHLTIGKDVFPPDFGLSARNMAKLTQPYAPGRALEVGCGSGYIALMMKLHGAAEVWAADIHLPAVDCARRNVEQNPQAGPLTVVQSDLLESIPAGMKFDLIIFNQPYAPGDERRPCGCGPDGGYEICKRFMLTAPPHLAPDGVLIMSFSDRAADENDPELVAKELGYSVKTLLHARYGNANNFVYEIRPPRTAMVSIK